MRNRLKWGLALVPCALVWQLGLTRQAMAQVTLSTQLTGVAQSSSVNLLDLGANARAGLVSQQTVQFGDGANAGAISYSGTSGIYMGNTTGLAIAPMTPTGVEARNYFATQPGGAITVNYDQRQRYFGVMWGSLDFYNNLAFYNDAQMIKSFSGENVYYNPRGNTIGERTYFANFNFAAGSEFNRVVFSTTYPAFEFNMIAYAPQTQAITVNQVAAAGPLGAPQTIGVPVNAAPVAGSPLLLGLLGWWRRRRNRRAA